MDINNISDKELLKEIEHRFDEKASSLKEMEFMTKKLMDMNEKSKSVQDVKSKFISLIKNEFNNPLSSLLNFSNRLLKTDDIVKVKTIGNMMQMDLIKLDFSLKNIFAASEIEAGEIGNDYTTIDLKEMFDELLLYLAYLIEEKSLDLQYVTTTTQELISDSQKIYLILLNVLSNACEYSYSHACVKMSVSSNEKEMTIEIEDSGEGIKDEHSKDIYNRFVFYNTGKTRATTGLGLGLSVARGMVEALNGEITNIKRDDNTIFVITIPFVSKEEISFSQSIGGNEFIFDENSDEFDESSSNDMLEF
jgi:K+-sensing histidine kinase KdpD